MEGFSRNDVVCEAEHRRQANLLVGRHLVKVQARENVCPDFLGLRIDIFRSEERIGGGYEAVEEVIDECLIDHPAGD